MEPKQVTKVWEPRIWKALGVDSIEIHEAEPEPITNEHIKAASSFIRGTIAGDALWTRARAR